MNITLITTETIFSPLINSSLIETHIDLDIPTLLIDGFRAASNRKAQITDPTISPKNWALKILNSVENLSPQEQWRALPPLAGIIQAIATDNTTPSSQLILDHHVKKQFQQLFVDYVNSTISFYQSLGPNFCQIPSTLLSLSAVFAQLEDSYKEQLNTQILLPLITDLVYVSPFGLRDGVLLRSVAKDNDAVELNTALNDNPVLRHLSSFSLLIQFLIHNSHPTEDVEVISSALKVISAFAHSLSTEYQVLSNKIGPDKAEQNHKVWRFLKLSLFSIAISFQGYTGWLLQHLPRYLYLKHAVLVSSTIIEAFSHIYFIVAQVSLSGFPTYDFVYYSCLDILLDPQFELEGISGIVENLAAPFMAIPDAQHSYDLIEKSLVNRGKLIYLLNICELLTPLSPFHPRKRSKKDIVTISDLIMPLARQFLVSPDPAKSKMTVTYFQPVLESAHSVFLSIISTPSQALEKNNGSRNENTLSGDISGASDQDKMDNDTSFRDTQKFLDNEIISYLDTVLSLFPGVLSPNQFTLAITTIVRAFSPPSPMYVVNRSRSHWILQQIYEKALDKIPPGHPLPQTIGTHQQQLNNTENSQNADQQNIPIPTTRAVVVSALIHSLPFVEISLLENWLDKTVQLVNNPTANGSVKPGPALSLEQQFLEADLFQMISEELEQYKSNVGIRWWFKSRL